MIGVERSYRERLRQLARVRGLETVQFSDDGWVAAASDTPALCVAGLLGGSQQDLYRVRRLGTTYPETPLVVLARNVAIDEVVGLMRIGVADVIELPEGRGSRGEEVALSPLRRRAAGGRTRSRRSRSRDAEAAPLGRDGRCHLGDAADHRRDGIGEGRGGACRSSSLGATRSAPGARRLRRSLAVGDRERALRTREGGIHRGGGPTRRALRAGEFGNHLSRRDRGSGALPPGQAPPRAAGAEIRARRGHQDPSHEGAGDRRHQPGSGARGSRTPLPRGSLLPAERASHLGSTAARSQGGHCRTW